MPADVSIVARDVPLHGGRSLAAAPPRPLRHGRPALAGDGHAALPHAQPLGAAGAPGSRPTTTGGATGSGWRKGAAEWTGPADAIQYRLRGKVTRCAPTSSGARSRRSPSRRLSDRRLADDHPARVVGRRRVDQARQGAPLRARAPLRRRPPHGEHQRLHPGRVGGDRARRSSVYHVKGNGWNDIGYNFLVDKYGQVFEGRYGGIDKAVIGAHALGFNNGSVGVALIGTYTSTGISAAARAALVKLLAWRLDVAHVDPLSFVNVALGRQPEVPDGDPGQPARDLRATATLLHRVPGHRPLQRAPVDRRRGRRDRAAEALRAARAGEGREPAQVHGEAVDLAAVARDDRGQDGRKRGERRRHRDGDRVDLRLDQGRAGTLLVDDGRRLVRAPGDRGLHREGSNRPAPAGAPADRDDRRAPSRSARTATT